MSANGISVSEDLRFCSFLLASKRLTFIGCVPAGQGIKVLFRFRDPDGLLPQLYEEYATGAIVAAIDFSNALNQLRRAMRGVENTMTTKGEVSNEHDSRYNR